MYWNIHDTIAGHYASIRLDSVIIHVCDEYKDPDYLVILDKGATNSECYFCETRAPEEIQIRWKLQNKDFIK